jgi:hypothetical protein
VHSTWNPNPNIHPYPSHFQYASFMWEFAEEKTNIVSALTGKVVALMEAYLLPPSSPKTEISGTWNSFESYFPTHPIPVHQTITMYALVYYVRIYFFNRDRDTQKWWYTKSKSL